MQVVLLKDCPIPSPSAIFFERPQALGASPQNKMTLSILWLTWLHRYDGSVNVNDPNPW